MVKSSLPSADAYTLEKIDWDFFGTLTFAKVPPRIVMLRMIHEFLRRVGAKFKCDYQWGLHWVVRHELGEMGGRPHFHFLIKLPGSATSNKTTSLHILKHLWKLTSEKPGKIKAGGFVDIRTYDSSRNAASYVVKGTGWDNSKANEYELAKFSQDRAWSQDQAVFLITSPSVPWTLFKRLRRRRSPKGGLRSRKGGGRCAQFLKGLKQGSVRQSGKQSRWSPDRLSHPADRVGRLYC